MKQDELVAFVDTLADAEHAAAEKICAAEAESEARLTALEQSLARKYKEKLEALEREWDIREKEALHEAEAKVAEMRTQTGKKIERLQARHARVEESLVHWAVNEVIGDA